MAKRAQDGEVNKSEAIRQVLKENRKLSVKEVVATLGEKGIEIKPNLVYFIKGKIRGNRGRRRRIRNDVANAVASNAIADPLTAVRKVKALALEVGGLRKLQALVEALAQ